MKKKTKKKSKKKSEDYEESKKKVQDLPHCESTVTAEHERLANPDEPCDDTTT